MQDFFPPIKHTVSSSFCKSTPQANGGLVIIIPCIYNIALFSDSKSVMRVITCLNCNHCVAPIWVMQAAILRQNTHYMVCFLFLNQVINFTMPNTVKHYVHRVGRTARAGKVGRSVSLVGETERKMLKDIVKKAKTPVKARVLPQGRG